MIQIKISRFHKDREPQTALSQFEIPLEKPTMLESFEYISQKLDPSFVFSSGCRSSVCGSCGVRVDGKEVLACQYRVQNGDEVAPLNYFEVLKDLVVGNKKIASTFSNLPLASDDSTCILCNLCYSTCPVFEVNERFTNPIILSRLWSRFPNLDENEKNESIKNIQIDGIWDCTLCGLCTEVCPQDIDSKSDIMKLQSVSAQRGLVNPNMFNMSFGFETQF